MIEMTKKTTINIAMTINLLNFIYNIANSSITLRLFGIIINSLIIGFLLAIKFKDKFKIKGDD
jgi:hypothetical protein